jgi:GDP-4-dehydro-6-deoxy-D-mannose reductase
LAGSKDVGRMDTGNCTRLGSGPILVTGAGGFVGKHLMEELGMGKGDIAADVHDQYSVPGNVRKVIWDLPSGAPDELGEVRYIVHLAAMSSVGSSQRNYRRAYEVNTMGTVSLLNYAAGRSPGARLLIVSSSEVYGPNRRRISEDDEISPINAYGASKAAAEIAAGQFRRNCDLDMVIARPFPHTGPGQSSNFAFPAFCRRILDARQRSAESISVGNLSPVRDYLYVSDVVRAYRHLLAEGRSGEIYNVCSGTGNRIGDLVRDLIGIAGIDLSLEVDPGLCRPVDVDYQVGDPSKIEKQLGWKPETDIREGLRKLFSWWEAKS